jgi:predicted nucleic acid-binding protein
MNFVLDASVTGRWAFADERTSLSQEMLERLKTGQATVPGLWWFEVRNLLIVNERRGRITEDSSEKFLDSLKTWAVIVDSSPDSDEVMRLARTHGLTAYDAAYLELALRRGLQLATLDQRLAAAAHTEGISVAGEGG